MLKIKRRCRPLLSGEQFKQLGELEDPDLEKITELIMDTKIDDDLGFTKKKKC